MHTLLWQTLADLARDHGDSFYLLFPDVFLRNYRDLRQAFRAIYPRSQIAYSYKTNYCPTFCRMTDREGGYAEVVSRMEYEWAVRLGVQPIRIIFNGPYKTADDLCTALSAGAVVNVDSPHEADEVIGLAKKSPGCQFRIGLRCRPGLDGEVDSRFGIDTARDLAEVARRLDKQPNIVVAGLHAHICTSTKSPDTYSRLAAFLLRQIERLPQPDRLCFLDLGGGFFSRMDHDLARQFPCPIPPFSAYAEVLAGALAKHFGRQQGPELIIEPGLALVADAMHYVAQINHLKRAGERTIALVSGSAYHIKPTLSTKNLPVTLVRAPSGKSMSPAGPVDIAGYTCMENDLLYRGYEGPVGPGDFAVFSNVGAYTLVLSPSFIYPRPAILVCDEQGRVIASEKQAESTADVFASFQIPCGTQAP